MIKLKSLVEFNNKEVEFISPDNCDFNYYDDVNTLEKQSGINILSNNEISILAILNNKVVGVLYTSYQGRTFSFDVIVDRQMIYYNIGPRLINMALSEYKSISDEFDIKLDVVNPGVEKYLLKKGFKTVNRVGSHAIMKLL